MIAALRPPLGAAALLLLVAGCAAPLQVGPDPAWFGRGEEPTTNKAAGRVALWVPPQVAAAENVSERPLGGDANLHVPVGRIVELAARQALGDVLDGGVQAVASMPAPGAGQSATLVVDTIRCVDRVRVLWLLPMPILGVIGDSQIEVQLTFDLRLIDARGGTVWTRSYDSGTVVWKRPPGRSESLPAGIVRLAHEAAWRLSQQAANDLREWLEAERVKPREL